MRVSIAMKAQTYESMPWDLAPRIGTIVLVAMNESGNRQHYMGPTIHGELHKRGEREKERERGNQGPKLYSREG